MRRHPPPPSPSPPPPSPFPVHPTEYELIKDDLFDTLVIPTIASSLGVVLATVVAVVHIQISDRQQLRCFSAFQITSTMLNSLAVLTICATNFYLFTIFFASLQLIAFVSTATALLLVCLPSRGNRRSVAIKFWLLCLGVLTSVVSGCVAAPLSHKVENGNLFLAIVFVQAFHAVHASTSLILLLQTY